ncbi:MAG: hypothetical protein KAT05_17540 [Spirochaetes bacterium]|nr:hypothetical protein [Spirochaetota bacterium]
MMVYENDIDGDVHREVKPEYLNKLEEIRKQKGVRFRNTEEFEAYFSE